jgi:hypothetical protein
MKAEIEIRSKDQGKITTTTRPGRHPSYLILIPVAERAGAKGSSAEQ